MDSFFHHLSDISISNAPANFGCQKCVKPSAELVLKLHPTVSSHKLYIESVKIVWALGKFTLSGKSGVY